MMAGTSTARRPERLATHDGRPGERIAGIAVAWDQRCGGDARALYARDKDRKWVRAGWACTRCGAIELEPGLLGTERDRWYGRRITLDPSAPYVGQLARVGVASPASVDTDGQADGVDTRWSPTTAVACQDCGDKVTARNLARHRKRHQS